MKTLLIAALLGLFVTTVGAATVTDTTSPKNELYVRGLAPHVKFVDDSGDDYTLTVAGDVMRVQNLNNNPFFNLPNNGTLGIELAAPTALLATPVAGGTLTPSIVYFFTVTAINGGETVGSTEATCATDVTNKRCDLTWSATLPPAPAYRVYYGVGAGGENKYITAVTNSASLTADVGVSGTPPAATTLYRVKLDSTGIVFPDGSSQATAGGAGAWVFNATHILSMATGNVGIFDGVTLFTPAAKLHILASGADVVFAADAYGFARIPHIALRKANGTFGAPTAAGNAETLAQIGVTPYDSTQFNTFESSYIRWVSTQAHGLGGLGTKMQFATVPNGDVAGTVWLTLDQDGSITGTGPTYLFGDTGSTTFSVKGTAGTSTLAAGIGTAGNAAVLRANAGVASSSILRLDRNSGADRFQINVSNSASVVLSWTGTNTVFEDGSSNIYAEILSTASANNTNLVLLRNNGSSTLVTVSIGAADSCGSGFRCLKVPN